ncbi:hypothetical protein RYH73_16380 [Olivibacter sp. CPCC 100613]
MKRITKVKARINKLFSKPVGLLALEAALLVAAREEKCIPYEGI